MVSLLDVNVLVALAWPSHMHHERAHAWFGEHSRDGWATCPITQCGFVRVSSNPAVFRDAVTPSEAASLLSAMASHRSHSFWPDSVSFFEPPVTATAITGYRQVTDFYLVRLASSNGGRVATFDSGLRMHAERDDLVSVIGV
jgi:uncharacterized protein